MSGGEITIFFPGEIFGKHTTDISKRPKGHSISWLAIIQIGLHTARSGKKISGRQQRPLPRILTTDEIHQNDSTTALGATPT